MTTTEKHVKCAWCDADFIKRRPNMIYCKKECCNASTNKKLIEKYHNNKKRKTDKNRLCISCSGKLSRYNEDEICFACQKKQSEEQKIKLLRELGIGYIIEE